MSTNWYDDPERAALCRTQPAAERQSFYERLLELEREDAEWERRQQFYAENGRGERERTDYEEHNTRRVVNGEAF